MKALLTTLLLTLTIFSACTLEVSTDSEDKNETPAESNTETEETEEPAEEPAEEPEESLTYTNLDYNFKLELPDNWEGYSTSSTTTEAFNNAVENIDMMLYDETIFTIVVFEKAVYEDLEKNADGPFPGKMGENDTYVFGWSPIQAGLSDEAKEASNDITVIVNSFSNI